MPIGTYIEGPAERPSIHHDNGCFENGDVARSPTWLDRGVAIGGRLGSLGYCSYREDLGEACAAYDHFLNGEGADRAFSYERFVADDESGETVLQNAISEAMTAAMLVYQRDFPDGGNAAFEFTQTDSIPVGASASAFVHAASFPYPHTENWQKTIGAHMIWLSGAVTVSEQPTGERSFVMLMTLHAEDRYNFNPGQQDITTGISDSRNCHLELSGLGHQYIHRATLERNVDWIGGDEDEAQSSRDQSIFNRDVPAPRTRRSRPTRGL